MLPAAAQASWLDPCGCQRVSHYRYYHSHYHHRYVLPRERSYVAVELAPNVLAIPYRLPRYPYVSGFDGSADRGIINTTRIVREAPVVVEDDGAPRENGKQRVIRAEAEVTILGPDRMNIRLFRKGRGRSIEAPAD
jgi:hypothetical protein